MMEIPSHLPPLDVSSYLTVHDLMARWPGCTEADLRELRQSCTGPRWVRVGDGIRKRLLYPAAGVLRHEARSRAGVAA